MRAGWGWGVGWGGGQEEERKEKAAAALQARRDEEREAEKHFRDDTKAKGLGEKKARRRMGRAEGEAADRKGSELQFGDSFF